jgi:hypothetical protein
MMMVEEPWMSSEKLDDGAHLQKIVKKEHRKDNLEIPSCVEHSTRDERLLFGVQGHPSLENIGM